MKPANTRWYCFAVFAFCCGIGFFIASLEPLPAKPCKTADMSPASVNCWCDDQSIVAVVANDGKTYHCDRP